MALYEFTCEKCLARVEILRTMTADLSAEKHAECEGPLRLRYSAPAVVYRGDGFAKKDRRGKKK